MSTLAQAAVDPLSSLVQYGVLGIFAALLVMFGRSLVKREQERADAVQAENLRLNQLIQDKTIPALVTATQAIQASQAILQAMQAQRDVETQVAARLKNPPSN